MGAAPLFPATALSQVVSTSLPIGVMAPSPVTTTLLSSIVSIWVKNAMRPWAHCIRLSEPETRLLLCCLDVVDGVAHGRDGLCLVIGDGDAEFLFELHDELNGVEAVCAEVGGESGGFGYLVFVHAELVDDDGFNSRCDF